jgi:signal transduction histidine kinase
MKELPNGKISIYSAVEDGMVRIFVQDYGEGISEKSIDKVFNPFFTTKSRADGTGLGLSISKSIIGKHGGQLRVSNTGGAGALFDFTIPVAEKES